MPNDARRSVLEEHARVATQAERAVDEHAAALGLQERPDLIDEDGDMHLDPERGERLGVFVGERFGKEPRGKAIVIPHFEERVLAEHIDFAGHEGDVTQSGLNQYSPLRIELRCETVEVDAVEKPLP
jgi:hypothetical protein